MAIFDKNCAVLGTQHEVRYILENLFGFSLKSNGCGCAARIGIRGSVGKKETQPWPRPDIPRGGNSGDQHFP